MNKAHSIQLKAVFLLMVFSLNMFAGFACALGVDMGFNTNHHQGVEATKIHIHADGSKHHHPKAGHSHSNKSGKEDCCNDKVVKLSQADKAVPQTGKLLNPVFFAAFVATYYSVNITYASLVNTPDKYFVRGHHPPIPNIRIAIQSFQI